MLEALTVISLTLISVSTLFWLLAKTTAWVDRVATQDEKTSK